MLLGFLALGQRGFIVPINGQTSSDFVSFYAAGKLTLAGAPALAYDRSAHYLVEQQFSGHGAPYQFLFYPPVFLFLCSALALLPYPVAYAVFQTATLGLFAWVMRGILGVKGWAWVAALLAFPAVFWNVGVGQNAFLSAALLGGFTVLADRWPASSGLLLGMLCYKPHFGLLAPFALIAGRRWRAFVAAAATVWVLILTSILLFGWTTWQAYFLALAGADQIYTSGQIDFAGMVTIFGAIKLLGFSNGLAYGAQTSVAVLMAGLVILIWRRPASPPLRGASLIAASLLAVPLILLYDHVLALVAIGWLIREAQKSGFLPWEKILLVATYPLSLLTWPVATAWHLPVGLAISILILSLCLRRIWLMRHAPAISPPLRAPSP